MNLSAVSRPVAIFLATLSLVWSQAVPGSNAGDVAVQSNQGVKQAASLPNQGWDPLFDLPRLKPEHSSLIGGTLESIDRLRGRLVLRPYGQGKLTIAFDPRTRFVRGEIIADRQDMHPGDRVYVETVLNGTAVFAKAIHLPTQAAVGTAVGQVVAYDVAQGNLSLHDQLSSQPVKFHVTAKTMITGAGVGPGALVQVSFKPGKDPAWVREILVLAAPGSVFTFAGRVTFLNLASHELVVANTSDDNRYEIQFNPAALDTAAKEHLQEGANVTVAAKFDGHRYVAESVTVLSSSTE